MQNLVLIVGNGAVGKMTVGQELSKLTGLRLLHNHMTIDPIFDILGYVNWDVVEKLRDIIFDEFAKSTDIPGIIQTFMWGFDKPEDWVYIGGVCDKFRDKGWRVCCLELAAPQSVRLLRNRTENRLLHKPLKRELERSEQIIVNMDKENRFESLPGEIESGPIKFDTYMKIDNTNVPPQTAATAAKNEFQL